VDVAIGTFSNYCQGEIDVCAFEGGLIGGKSSKSILPLLSQMMPTKVNMVK
jgi:hypothetical protein